MGSDKTAAETRQNFDAELEATSDAQINSQSNTTSQSLDAIQLVVNDDVDLKFTEVRVELGKIQFICVLLSLILGLLLASLDQTIVTTALKSIVTDLGQEQLNSWIGSAYMMTSCVFCSLYGKFSDVFGRKLVFLTAIIVFEIGSLVCGLASSMAMLIVGRAIAGAGGGGILSLAMIILSDIVSIQDRGENAFRWYIRLQTSADFYEKGKYQGFFGATYAVAAVMGPLVGGVFVDQATWRWCFFINLPVGAITVIVIIFFLNFPSTDGSLKEKIHRIDFLGSSILAVAIVLLLIPIQLGGNDWPWSSPQTITCFILSAFATVMFVYVEGKVVEPIVPHALFETTTVSALLFMAFFTGAGFFASVYYNALFFQIAQGYSAIDAGVQAIPFQIGVCLLSITSGLIVTRTGQYKFFFFVGPVVNLIGVGLMATMNQSTTVERKIVYLFIAGVGTGPLNQMTALALQASVDSKYIAIVTSIQRTFQQLGGSIGLSIIGNILNVQLNSRISDATRTAIENTIPAADAMDPVSAIQYLQDYLPMSPILSELVDAFVASYQVSYFSVLVFPAVVFFAAFFVTQYEVKRHAPRSNQRVKK